MAAENGIEIEFIRSKKSFRKEDRVKEILEKRGKQPGLVCILSAMEPCGTYKPWHDKKTHKTYLKPDDGKCLHYYFYFIDDDLGLCPCGCQPGVHSGFSSTATGTVFWRGRWANARLNIRFGQRLWLDRGLREGPETGR